MCWADSLVDRRIIDAFYSTPPSLCRVNLHAINMNRDGPTVTLRFDLSTYPDRVPPKWVARQCNTAHLTLRLLAVKSLQIEGWDTEIVGDIDIVKDAHGVCMSFHSDVVRVTCSAGFVDVERIEGYTAQLSEHT
ncbi:MAG: hypothetical protein IT428_23585 [Planctomycetaceae bacterium]|nr:hypothetical protein [Planctomycetaceae bacterium]